MGKTKRRGSRKIAAAIAVCLFNLTATFAGVLAWFKANDNVEVTAGLFEVENKAVEVNSVNLIKFEYQKEILGTTVVYNYLQPEKGFVKEYTFSESQGYGGSFGYYARYMGNKASCVRVNDFYIEEMFGKKYVMLLESFDTNDEPRFVNDGEYNSDNNPTVQQLIWRSVDVMNLYDPAELIIHNSDLRALNCNAIYELELSVYNMANFYLNLKAILKPDVEADYENDREILLSSCANFDVFFERDIQAIGEEENIDVTSVAGKYEAISLLAADSTRTHAHLYSTDEENPETLSEVNVCTNENFQNQGNTIKVYVNVDYASDRLDQYTREISLYHIRAKYDFIFKLSFNETGGVQP